MWDEIFDSIKQRKEKGLEILPFPHPILTTPTIPVKNFDENLSKFVRLMFDIMYDRKGVGLAANQIGVPLSIFVLNITENHDPKKELVFINPKIEVKAKNRLTKDEEGCLSIPGLYKEITRPFTITFSAFKENGKPFKGEYNALTARVIQHEYDHLLGKLFTDDEHYLQYCTLLFENIKNSPEILKSIADIERIKECFQ